MLQEQLIDNKYTKYYISHKQKNKQLYFKVDYHFNIFIDTDKRVNFSMEAKVSYLILVKDNKTYETLRRSNNWDLTSFPHRKSCSLNNCVIIADDYKSYGVGTLLLHEILSKANKYIPEYSLCADLSFVDEGEDNKERRDTLYKNIGFKFRTSAVYVGENKTPVTKNEIYTEKLSDLKFYKEFDSIEVLDEYKIADLFCKLNKMNEDLISSNKTLANRANFYKNDNTELYSSLRKHKLIILGLILITISLFLLNH